MANEVLIPEERIANLIVVLRDEKVMLDVHLAELYGVETRTLKQLEEDKQQEKEQKERKPVGYKPPKK